jgi:adenylate cyclase
MAGQSSEAVLFADVSGSTKLYETAGNAVAHAAVGSCVKIMREKTLAAKGRVVKTIGDEVMFVGLNEPVVVSALALVRRATGYPELPPVRAGVARGHVLARDGDFYGPVVNLASRLTDMAKEGSVLASAAVHAGLERDQRFAWRPAGTRSVRSIGEVEVYEVSTRE